MSDREYDRGFEDGAQSRNAEITKLRYELSVADYPGKKELVAELSRRQRKLAEYEEEVFRLREGHRICEENMDAEIDRLREALETGRCPRCGEWFRDDPKTSNVLKETT